MAREDRRPRRSRGTQSCGCGCASFLLVITVGIVLSVFSITVGLGVSVRVPFTSGNITLAGSIGAKDKVEAALPGYDQERLGRNNNFINQSQTLTIGPAEGVTLFVIGKQDGAPVFDVHVVAR